MRWNFPSNGCGQIRGFSDAGIETFTGKELQSLTREICQNSLDAAINEDIEVKVEFKKYTLPVSSMPGYDEYYDVIKNCYEYWRSSESEKANEYLKKAYDAIKGNQIFVLRISDYNTTGLAGPYDDRFDGWNALTKIDGGATKSGDKAGSFGIGKNAPFTNSLFRLVFYRTLNQDGVIAAQGISRLLSFPSDLGNIKNTMTTGIGYYGDSVGNNPVESIRSLDKICKREECGTDVFIFGFDANYNRWINEMCLEILNNFMMSIYNGKLSVKIEDNDINKETISGYMEKHKADLRHTYFYNLVQARAEHTQVYIKDFHGLGEIKLKILVDDKEKLNRKILVTRKSGMKLFDLNNMSKIISFSGILEICGSPLNEYFREMENPAHDKWIPTRHHNPIEAKMYIEELKQWVRGIIIELGEYSSDEEIVVEGLSGVLQDENETMNNEGDDKKESLDSSIESILINQRKEDKSQGKGILFGGGTQFDRKNHIEGKIDLKGSKDAVRTLKGTRTRAKRSDHKGRSSEGGDEKILQNSDGNNYYPLDNVRIMKLKHNYYRAIFQLPRDITHGYMEIITVGENGRTNLLKILDGNGVEGCENVQISPKGLEFSSMSSERKVKIEFSLIDDREYAMEVNIYEYN